MHQLGCTAQARTRPCGGLMRTLCRRVWAVLAAATTRSLMLRRTRTRLSSMAVNCWTIQCQPFLSLMPTTDATAETLITFGFRDGGRL